MTKPNVFIIFNINKFIYYFKKDSEYYNKLKLYKIYYKISFNA